MEFETLNRLPHTCFKVEFELSVIMSLTIYTWFTLDVSIGAQKRPGGVHYTLVLYACLACHLLTLNRSTKPYSDPPTHNPHPQMTRWMGNICQALSRKYPKRAW